MIELNTFRRALKIPPRAERLTQLLQQCKFAHQCLHTAAHTPHSAHNIHLATLCVRHTHRCVETNRCIELPQSRSVAHLVSVSNLRTAGFSLSPALSCTSKIA